MQSNKDNKSANVIKKNLKNEQNIWKARTNNTSKSKKNEKYNNSENEKLTIINSFQEKDGENKQTSQNKNTKNNIENNNNNQQHLSDKDNETKNNLKIKQTQKNKQKFNKKNQKLPNQTNSTTINVIEETTKPTFDNDNINDQNKEKIKNAQVKLSLSDFQNTIKISEKPNDKEEPSRILWIGNIGQNITEKDLDQEFSQFGKIESLRILHDRYCAFVNFEDEKAAQLAKKSLHGSILGGQYIVVNYRKNNNMGEEVQQLNPPTRALWVGNISEEIDENYLYEEFHPFGPIESIRLLRQRTCAFVNFFNVNDAYKALQALQGKKMGSMSIRINYGKPYNKFPLPPQIYPNQYMMNQPYIPDYGTYTISPYMYPPVPIMPLPMMDPNLYYSPHLRFSTTISICELCNKNIQNNSFIPCNHLVCSECSNKILETSTPDKQQSIKCPFCKTLIQKIIPLNVSPNYYHQPSEMLMMPSENQQQQQQQQELQELQQELQELQQESQKQPTDNKEQNIKIQEKVEILQQDQLVK